MRMYREFKDGNKVRERSGKCYIDGKIDGLGGSFLMSAISVCCFSQNLSFGHLGCLLDNVHRKFI